VERIPRRQYPAEHKDRKGAPTFLLPSSRVAFGADSWLILPTASGVRNANEKNCYLHLKLDEQRLSYLFPLYRKKNHFSLVSLSTTGSTQVLIQNKRVTAMDT